MDFSLSSSLVGNAVSNPDKLALDLQFATDKTLTARKGPTPVFTRGSSATFVDSDKLVKYGPENLLLQSENFLSGWSVFGASVQSVSSTNPFGGGTSYKLTESAANAEHGIFRTSVITSGLATASIYAKEAGRRFCYLRSDGNTLAVFDLVSGIVTQVSAGTTASITDAGNGWWRLSFTSQITGNYVLKLSNTGTGLITVASYLGNGTSGVLIWGAQLERFSTSRTYLPTTTSVYYGPRFDHDPVTGVCKGLLMEESRTNSLIDSNAFNNWSLSNSTVAASSVVNPEGSLNAWKVVEDSSLATHTATRSFTPISGTTYTSSIWLKSAENGFAFVGFSGGGFATTFISVNLSTGVVSTALGTPLGATSVAHSNGWWRVSFSLVATAALVSNIDIRLSRDGLWANRSYLGNGVNGIYCYGAQVESGAFPTSYIPTTTASVIRSADVCSIDSSNFAGIWNGVDMTMFFKGSRIDNKTSQVNWELTSGTSATSIASDRGTTTERITANAVGIMQIAAFTTLTEYKIAAALKAGDYAVSFNGAAAISSSNAFVLTLNRMTIGMNRVNSSTLNGCVHSIQSYKKRLPNSKLQTLTV